MATKLTKEQQNIDREINRINRQIRQAFTLLGKESRLAKQYETILSGYSEGGKQTNRDAPMQHAGMLRQTKTGIPQLSRSKKTIEMIRTGSIGNTLIQLGRQQTVHEAQKAMVKAYEKRTGQKVKGKAAAKSAVESEVNLYKKTQSKMSSALMEMYRIEKERGVKFKNHDEIKKLSKGRWTSQEDLDKMISLAEETVQNENAAVIEQHDALAGY